MEKIYFDPTPYYYSTYETTSEHTPSSKSSVLIIGGGPNRIGQGIEFDYRRYKNIIQTSILKGKKTDSILLW